MKRTSNFIRIFHFHVPEKNFNSLLPGICSFYSKQEENRKMLTLLFLGKFVAIVHTSSPYLFGCSTRHCSRSEYFILNYELTPSLAWLYSLIVKQDPSPRVRRCLCLSSRLQLLQVGPHHHSGGG